ncbi:MAG TPA: HAD family hydrolase [Terracidiphilus sp.]|nr:HAD family hydrolase [Terracidiphilus sp.]
MTGTGSVAWNDVRTVFLDRDGVLNRKAPEGEYVWCTEDFHVFDGVADAIARLNRAGIRVVVVTNQRGVALGHYTLDDVKMLHAEFQKQLAAHGAYIDRFYVCPHDNDECNCRKPLPGLFEQARADFPEIDVSTSVMIGDSRVDMQFGKRLGMRTILIESSEDIRKLDDSEIDIRRASLLDAVELLLH